MSTDRQTVARDWGRLIQAVTGPAGERNVDSSLALAMSLGSAITADGLACSVALVSGSGHHTPVWSDALALDLDRAQYDAGAGPCVATARDGHAHSIEVMADETRYAAFTAEAVRRGVHSSLSLPLSLPLSRRAVPGALNLYARTTSAYRSQRARATAELLARCVGILLADDPDRRNPGLDAALDQHDLVERAATELVRRGAADQFEAYVRLTQLSRSRNCSIFAVAADVVGEGTSSPQLEMS